MFIIIMGNCFGQEEEPPIIIPYHEKYNAKFDSLSVSDQYESAEYNHDFVMEYVRDYGNIIMKYDKVNETFFYYSDRHVSNEILEIVSKKYALQFHCKHLYNDHKKDDNEKEKEETNNETTDIPNVYGKFKERQLLAQKRQENVEKKINDYIYLGKVRDFKMIQPVQHKTKAKKMSYADFKKSRSLKIDV